MAPSPKLARSRGSSDIQVFTAKIGNKPFAMSPIKVIKAPVLLPSRSILVAPGLLEPEFRGSGRRKTIDTRIALDREPIKYAKRGKDQ